jgi:hypothetical protein
MLTHGRRTTNLLRSWILHSLVRMSIRLLKYYLELLTKLTLAVVPADEGAAEFKEGLMNIETTLIANGQMPEVSEPRQGTLDDPSMLTQFGAALDAASGNTRRNAPLPEGCAVGFAIVPFISVQLGRALTGSPPFLFEGWNGIYYHLQRGRIRNVGSGTPHREGNTASADHKMALRAWFAFIRWVRADGLTPFLARMLVESSTARDQSISPAWLSLSNSTLCTCSHTPACCQSRRRRQ